MSETEFETLKEEWNEYRLKDGTLIKAKLIMTGIQQVKGQYDALGNPAYVFMSTNVVKLINVPAEAKKPQATNKPV